MTATDSFIHIYYWLKCGLSEISLPMSVINFVTIITVLFTQKGIFVPMWVIPVVAIVVIAGCVFIGWFNQKYDIYSRTNSIINQQMNPEIKQISDDVKAIKASLAKKEKDELGFFKIEVFK